LFADVDVLELTGEEIGSILEARQRDWSKVDPSIFGTLFERGLDPDKRSQLGAHYTTRQDVEAVVEPVVMQPLRPEWEATRGRVADLMTKGRRWSRRGRLPATLFGENRCQRSFGLVRSPSGVAAKAPWDRPPGKDRLRSPT
jgi:hypothetical protein